MRPGFDLQGKRVLVVGLARTGVVASLFSAGYGATVTATDTKAGEQLGEPAARLRAAGVKLELGAHTPSLFLEQDLIVVSPGVPAKLPALELARPGESRCGARSSWLGGSCAASWWRSPDRTGRRRRLRWWRTFLKTAGIATLVGGNIGVPLLALVETSTDSTVTVAEISSFQLETIQEFRPEIGVLLNLTPDHLDRHESFEAYARAKMRMFENQLERDAAVLNADDPEITKRMPSRPHIYWFSRQKRVAEGAFRARRRDYFSRRRLGNRGGATQRNSACAASTTWKTCWRRARLRILRGRRPRRLPAASKRFARWSTGWNSSPRSTASSFTTIRRLPMWMRR